MYGIGEKIVYPMHGAGVIVEIEEKEILGETRAYYFLEIPYDKMKIMLPVDTCDEIGVRPVISDGEIPAVIEVLKGADTEMDSNWNRRYRDNLEKMKTGDLANVAEIVRNLMRIDRFKKLSTGEKKMLTNAKRIIASEFMLSKDIDIDEAEKIIDDAVFNT